MTALAHWLQTVLNMSAAAACVALAVMIVRSALPRLPKLASYTLWLAVLVRLVLPVSFALPFSLLGWLGWEERAVPERVNTAATAFIPETRPSTSEAADGPASPQPATATDGLLTGTAADAIASGNPLNAAAEASSLAGASDTAALLWNSLSLLWVAGFVLVLAHGLYAYIRVARRVRTATRLGDARDRVYETDRIDSPFVLGLLRPVVIVPTGLSQEELDYILEHERTHIRRGDQWVSLLGFVAVAVHWFNPVIWLSFSLMRKDMEMACDESVLQTLGGERKAGYSKTLLALASDRRGFRAGSPVAFGERDIQQRIRNILAYRKPAVWVMSLSVVLTAILLVLLSADPADTERRNGSKPYGGTTATANRPALAYDLSELLKYRTPYVGDNSKVGGLARALPLPPYLSLNGIQLKTQQEPYGLTLEYRAAVEEHEPFVRDLAWNEQHVWSQSIVLFSLIDNVDQIEFLLPGGGETDGAGNAAVSRLTFTRQAAEQFAGGDVRQLAQDSAKALETLLLAIHEQGYDWPVWHEQLERLLTVILSSPRTSSNPSAYIAANRDEAERIIKLGDEALVYLLAQFEQRHSVNDLKGHVMMRLCLELLGDADDPAAYGLSPQQWYEQFLNDTYWVLPDFRPDALTGISREERLVYEAVMEMAQNGGTSDDVQRNERLEAYQVPVRTVSDAPSFAIAAATIHGYDEEQGKLRIFSTVYSSRYAIFRNQLSARGGSVVPAALTFSLREDGRYSLEQTQMAQDGSAFASSIRAFSVRPVSGQPIDGMAARILNDYGSNERRNGQMQEHLRSHLERYGLRLLEGNIVTQAE